MITLGEHTIKRHRASWHKDPALTQRQASLLGRDVLATRDRLIKEVLVERVGTAKGRVQLRPGKNGLVWVVWIKPDDRTGRGEALAVFTHPVTSVKGFHMIVEWHWSPVGSGRN